MRTKKSFNYFAMPALGAEYGITADGYVHN